MIVINNKADASELTGQVIDIFEDFLENKNIHLNDDHDNNQPIISGSDYDTLKTQIDQLLMNWQIIQK